MGQERGHLTPQEREAYLAGTLLPGDLLSADRHLQDCDECMGTLAAERSEPPLVSVNELTDVEVEHLSFEQMSAHVDARLDAIESSIVTLHLEDCEACRSDVAGLVTVRSEIEAARSNEARPRAVPFWRTWKILIPAFGVLAAVLLIWSIRPGDPPKQIDEIVAVPSPDLTPSPAPTDVPLPSPEPEGSPATLAELNDAGGTIGINDEGEVVGVGSLSPRMRESLKNALADGSVVLGPGVERSSGGVLMGGAEGVPFGLTYPVGEVVLPQRPRFRWRPAEGASSYRVRVFDDSFNEISSSPELTATEWTAATPLTRGRAYRWQVTATVDGKEVMSPVRPAPDAVFRIVDAESADEIESVRRQHPNSDLLLGLAYARAGMRKEAEREFNSLLRRNPRSEIARKLLRQVRGR